MSSSSSPDASYYWMPHPERAWVPAALRDAAGDALSLEWEGERATVRAQDTARVVRSTVTRVYADLSNMEDFSEGSILWQIRERFLKDLIYTYVSNIVVAVNPYQRLPIYTPEVLAKYVGYLRGGGLDGCSPHVFGVAARAFMGMCISGKRQSVLISGESGAGKTETTKKVLYFLGSLVRGEDGGGSGGSGGGEAEEDTIEDKLMMSNPILEAFGNAKTVMNDNSSRFGKWMEIFFDAAPAQAGQGKVFESCGPQGWSMLGGAITSYILEKSRVSFQMPGERNFHIFYMILAAASDAERARWHLEDPHAPHTYIFSRRDARLAGRNEAQEHADMLRAFRSLRFEPDEVERMLRTVAAVLHLGDVSFEAAPAKADDVPDAGPVSQLQESSRMSLQWAAELLQVDVGTLLGTMLVHKTRLFTRPRSPDKAASSRDALAKDLYRRMFDHLVGKINEQLGAMGTSRHQIGVLDIFGFEIFETNSFEQLCINYANESLQKHFNTVVSDGERRMYEAEGVPCDHMEASIAVDDNRICINLIGASRMGIMSLLDDQVKHGTRASDEAWLRSMNYAFTKQGSKTFNRCYIKDRIRKDIFTVSHFAGEVTYSIEGFVEKNKDRLPDTMVLCMRGSANVSLASWFAGDEVENVGLRGSVGSSSKGRPGRGGRRGGGRGGRMRATVANPKARRKARGTFRGNIGTLGYKFKDQLKELQTSLDATQPHFIRCIKPNSFKYSTATAPRREQAFHGVLSLRQLRYSGLFEVIRIRRAGFWFRYQHNDFAVRYRPLAPSAVPQGAAAMRSANWRHVAEQVIKRITEKYPEARCDEERAWAVGKTKVFLRSSAVRDALEKLRNDLMHVHVCRLQAMVRRTMARKRWHLMIDAVAGLRLSLKRMDQDGFTKAVARCAQYPTLKRHVDAAKVEMAKIIELIRARKRLAEALAAAIQVRAKDALGAAVARAKRFVTDNPAVEFERLSEAEALIQAITTETAVLARLRRSCTGGNGAGQLGQNLADARALIIPTEHATEMLTWIALGKAVLDVHSIVTARTPLQVAVAYADMLADDTEAAQRVISRVTQDDAGLAEEAAPLRALLQEATQLHATAQGTASQAARVSAALTQATKDRHVADMKRHVKEAEKVFDLVGVAPRRADANANATDGMTLVSRVLGAQSAEVEQRVLGVMQPLLAAVLQSDLAIEKLEQQWDAIQAVVAATRAQDERRILDALEAARRLDMDAESHAEIAKAEATLVTLRHRARVAERLKHLARAPIGICYDEVVDSVKEAESIGMLHHPLCAALRRERAALRIQQRFRRRHAASRVAKLKDAMRELTKSMEKQNIVEIAACARRVRDLFQDDNRPEVQHARYAISFLRNKDRVLRDVARAEALLETSRATAYAMEVLGKALKAASSFNMGHVPKIQGAARTLDSLQRGRRARDALRTILKREMPDNTVDLRATADIIEAALKDVGGSRYPVDAALTEDAAAKLHIIQTEIECQTLLRKAVLGSDLAQLEHAVDKAQRFRELHGRAEGRALDKPLHEAMTMIKFYRLSGEFGGGGVQSQLRGQMGGGPTPAWELAAQRRSIREGISPPPSPKLGPRSGSGGARRPSATSSTRSSSSPSTSRTTSFATANEDPKALFLKWCKAMASAPNDEVRQFWFQKLEGLVGGPEKLRHALQAGQWKRISRQPPTAEQVAEQHKRDAEDRDTLRRAKEQVAREMTELHDGAAHGPSGTVWFARSSPVGRRREQLRYQEAKMGPTMRERRGVRRSPPGSGRRRRRQRQRQRQRQQSGKVGPPTPARGIGRDREPSRNRPRPVTSSTYEAVMAARVHALRDHLQSVNDTLDDMSEHKGVVMEEMAEQLRKSLRREAYEEDGYTENSSEGSYSGGYFANEQHQQMRGAGSGGYYHGGWEEDE